MAGVGVPADLAGKSSYRGIGSCILQRKSSYDGTSSCILPGTAMCFAELVEAIDVEGLT